MKLKEKKKKNEEGSYFPEEILEEIFLRLPNKFLLRFKCLSKFFYALFGNPNFQNRHHELINLKDNRWVVLYDKSKNNRSKYTIDYKSLSFLLPLSPSATMSCDCHEYAKRLMDYPSIFQDYDEVDSWYSCRGLTWICTVKGSRKSFYIWNMITQGCNKIPVPRKVKVKNLDGYGFGYDRQTDNYKLIIIVANWDIKCSDVVVYTLGTNSWRKIRSIPYSLDYPHYFPGVNYNEVPHWLAHDFDEGYGYTKLVCFDIVNERFKEVALPEKPMPYPEEPLEDNMFDMSLEVFEGCLCLVFHVFSVRVDVWMMQEYGVRESWAKIFSCCLDNLTTSTDSEFVWYFKNGETLWRDDCDGDLILYDPNKKICTKLILDSDVAETVTLAENHKTSSVLK